MEAILEALQAQLNLLFEVIPALLKAFVIILVGYLLAKLVRNILKRLLEAVGIDKLADKLMDIELLQSSNFNLVPSAAISSAAYYFILIIFIMAAVEAMGLKIISDLLKDLIAYIPNGVTALLVLVLGIFLADTVKKIIYETCRSLGISSGNLIANVVFYFILLNIILIALRQAQLQTRFMEANITVMLAGVAGAFAIGYGLASRHVMGSLLASFYNRGRLKVGDDVTIDGMRGEIVTMNNSDLVLRAEESEYIIPFSKLTSESVQIHSRREVGPPLPPNREG
ncbi:mechanosensitive ion channel domain-containing protein [Lewinella sp. 4G2]|uniref:mechanosensitive ion channel family protein n=1 Tax=Lewinella sp. 4G2 TaxID=1803372 RepID=UPI0007B4EC09|nr:mechanosensitive ion channel domain-containing protein [Lewinella sp. 4G2]OAV42654.1 hypothetical protein A3850_015530 [Lewinella sp. 4G2]